MYVIVRLLKGYSSKHVVYLKFKDNKNPRLISLFVNIAKLNHWGFSNLSFEKFLGLITTWLHYQYCNQCILPVANRNTPNNWYSSHQPPPPTPWCDNGITALSIITYLQQVIGIPGNTQKKKEKKIVLWQLNCNYADKDTFSHSWAIPSIFVSAVSIVWLCYIVVRDKIWIATTILLRTV